MVGVNNYIRVFGLDRTTFNQCSRTIPREASDYKYGRADWKGTL